MNVGDVEHRAGGERDAALEDVLKFADVARPVKVGELLHGGGRDAADFAGILLGKAREEKIDEGGDVFPVVAQRRDVDGDDVEAIVEVLAEGAFLEGGAEIAIRRGDEADIDFESFRAAEALEFAFLENPKKFDLNRGRDVADFVEEKRALVGELEFSGLRGRGAGEGALFVAEQFAFEKIFGDGGAVDFEERARGAQGMFVDGARDEVLADAAFAAEEDGGVGGRDALDEGENFLHATTFRDDVGVLVALAEGFAEGAIFFAQFARVELLANDEDHLGERERFQDVVARAHLHRFDGGFDRAVGRHHDNRDGGVDALGGLEEFEAVHARKAKIRDDEIDFFRGQELEAGFGVGGGLRGEAFFTEIELEEAAELGFVFDDENRGHEIFLAFRRGRRSRKKHTEARAAVIFGDELNRAAVIIHDFGNNRKPQADAGLLGRDEGIENLFAEFGGDARAGVFEFDGDARRAFARIRNDGDAQRAAWIRLGRLRGRAAFGAHGFEGVEDEIEENLFAELLVGENFGEIGGEFALNFDVRGGKLIARGVEGAIDERGDGDGAKIEMRGAGEIEEARDERIQAVHFGRNVTSEFAGERRSGAEFLREHFGGALDDAEGIANFVGEAGGKLAEGGKTFGAAGFFLSLLQFAI